jgi:hypothetical protein
VKFRSEGALAIRYLSDRPVNKPSDSQEDNHPHRQEYEQVQRQASHHGPLGGLSKHITFKEQHVQGSSGRVRADVQTVQHADDAIQRG